MAAKLISVELDREAVKQRPQSEPEDYRFVKITMTSMWNQSAPSF